MACFLLGRPDAGIAAANDGLVHFSILTGRGNTLNCSFGSAHPPSLSFIHWTPATVSAPLFSSDPPLVWGVQPYLRCSGSYHGNWGRQYLRVAVFDEREGRAVAGEVPFSAARRSDFSSLPLRAVAQRVTAGPDLESVSGEGRGRADLPDRNETVGCKQRDSRSCFTRGTEVAGFKG